MSDTHSCTSGNTLVFEWQYTRFRVTSHQCAKCSCGSTHERASSNNVSICRAAYTSAQGASYIPQDGRSNCKITYYMYVYIELATCMYKLTGQLPYIIVCKPAYMNGSAHQLAGRRATPLWVVWNLTS